MARHRRLRQVQASCRWQTQTSRPSASRANRRIRTGSANALNNPIASVRGRSLETFVIGTALEVDLFLGGIPCFCVAYCIHFRCLGQCPSPVEWTKRLTHEANHLEANVGQVVTVLKPLAAALYQPPRRSGSSIVAASRVLQSRSRASSSTVRSPSASRRIAFSRLGFEASLSASAPSRSLARDRVSSVRVGFAVCA